MNRNEFMELVYETFADEPDNVLANGIIEATDAYAEHEKAQLFCEGTTKGTISRQAALEKVRAMQTYKLFKNDDMLLVDKAEVQTELMMLPSVQPEPPWIPVSERLPEDMQYVLLTVRRLNNAYNPTPFISVGYIGWNQHHWWCAHDGDCEISNVEVLAWMPLPEPYQSEVERRIE